MSRSITRKQVITNIILTVVFERCTRLGPISVFLSKKNVD